MPEILQIAGSLGVGAFLGALIFLLYRIDRKASETKYLDAWRKSEERLIQLIDRDQETREASTKALSELTVVLRVVNGRLK